MRKKTINILTLNGYYNYGNRLQLFALARQLSEFGFNPMVYWPLSGMTALKHFLKYRTTLRHLFPKEKRLYSFTKRFLPKRSSKKAEMQIIGSDQVWNLSYCEKFPYLFDVPFAKNTISYAASIGRETLNGKEELFCSMLQDFGAISVREQSAKKMLVSLTDKKIEVVLDPTLLLDKEEYEAFEHRPKGVETDEKYILCYILGNRDHEEKIEKYAKENGYKTIYFSDKRDSNYGIEEFLYLIHHAQLICTDSFHACVFSFIFERPFVAFRRTGEENYMYTRLQNLIGTFRLKNREFNGEEITEENLEVDYTEAKKILKKEQKKSLDFLKRALDIKDEN